MSKLFTLLSFIILHCTFLIAEAMAQTPPPGGNSSVGAPLDGFTSLLLAAGVGYGITRYRKNNQSNIH